MTKSGSTVSSLNQITRAGYRDAEEVNSRFEQPVRESKRKNLFVSMNTQAIKASIIQATCRKKPLHAVQPRVVPRLLMLEQCKRSRAITNKALQEDALQNYT